MTDKPSPLLNLDDAALGAFTRRVANAIQDCRGQNVVSASTLLLISEAVQGGCTKLRITLTDVDLSPELNVGDWMVTVEKLKPVEEPKP